MTNIQPKLLENISSNMMIIKQYKEQIKKLREEIDNLIYQSLKIKILLYAKRQNNF